MSIDDRLHMRIAKSKAAIKEAANSFIKLGTPAQKTLVYSSMAMQEVERRATTEVNDAILRDERFLAACTKANVEPTRKQASKFRRSEGAAWAAFEEMCRNGQFTTGEE